MRVESPGFCDLQVNGFAGIDFNDPSLTAPDLDRALEAMRATGVTLCLPTLITSPFESFAACARTIAGRDHPAIAGLHMEGPYLAHDARGAHPPQHLRAASIDDFERRQEAARGRIVVVTLAPEVPGAIALTAHLAKSGVHVAIGHTAAAPEQIRDAIAAGADMSTHLGNGCPAMVPRHPNFLWEQLASDALVAGVIADGHHLPAAVVKTILRAKGLDRTVLVTDAISAAGQRPGSFRLGELDIDLTAERRVQIRGTTNLAGSALTLDDAVGNTVRFSGLPLELVLPLASTGPARYLGRSPRGRVVAEWDPVAYRLHIVEVRDS